ncbi:hypothetical protein Lal_00017022 [Lupinus albus]|nr:hypothetical protein Lal_00017022 [Lupinus albus]
MLCFLSAYRDDNENRTRGYPSKPNPNLMGKTRCDWVWVGFYPSSNFRFGFGFYPSSNFKFKDGEHAWAPSSGVLPNNVQNSDSYESSGNSEYPTIGASSSLSGRKRKNDCSMSGKESKKIQHKKMTNYFDKILGAVQSRTRGPINDINEELSDPYSIANVIRDVKKLPSMELDSKLLAQSSHVLLNPAMS